MIVLLCFLVSIGQFATVIYLPSMPAISHQLQAGPTATELTLTFYMVAFGLSQLVYGSLSDLYGRKRILLFSMVLYCLSSLASALSPTITFF